jgi:DNA-binding XRE family transcriptional regulator
MAARREGLARRRAAMGFTQESLAEHLGLERSTVGRWERGTGTPQPWNQPDLARVLGLSHDALADILGVDPVLSPPDGRVAVLDVAHDLVAEFNWPDWQQAGQASVLEPPWSITGTMQVLHEVTGGSMDRHGFLIITGATLAGVADQWSSSLGGAVPPTERVEQHRDCLSDTVLDRLDHRLADLRRLDDEFGGRELHELAVAEFRWLTRLADQADDDNAAGRRLFSLVTEAARLCGWLHFDAAHHAAAQSYYVAALRSSASANDPMTGAHVLACMSFQATLTGHNQEAVALIDAAEEQTKHAATPRLRALLASRKARAFAKAGDAPSCGRALNKAERRLDATTPEIAEPDWIYFFDEAELAAQAAACWVDLRQPAKARPLIDNALSNMSPQYIRDRTIYHVRSAEAHLHANDLELACNDLHTAADLADQTGSVRSVHTIRSAREAMSRYDREPQVQDLDRRLADLAA